MLTGLLCHANWISNSPKLESRVHEGLLKKKQLLQFPYKILLCSFFDVLYELGPIRDCRKWRHASRGQGLQLLWHFIKVKVKYNQTSENRTHSVFRHFTFVPFPDFRLYKSVRNPNKKHWVFRRLAFVPKSWDKKARPFYIYKYFSYL